MKICPSNLNIVSKCLNSFRNLHIEDNILYSIPNCRVFECRGNTERVILQSIIEENLLLITIASISRLNSYLDVMYSQYLLYVESLKKGVAKKRFLEFLQQFYITNHTTKLQYGVDESDEDLTNDHLLMKGKNYLSFLDIYKEAIIFSQLFHATPLHEFNSLHDMSLNKKYNFVCHYDRVSNQKYFGIPLYFFRATLTSAVQSVPMTKVKWIPLQTLHSYRSCEICLITVSNWNAQNYDDMYSENRLNPFISLQQLEPSRYALSYIPIQPRDIYVSASFIALDGDNLGDGIENDEFIMDFGDNILNNYLGVVGEVEDEEDEELQILEEYNILKKYIPTSILHYLTTN